MAYTITTPCPWAMPSGQVVIDQTSQASYNLERTCLLQASVLCVIQKV